MYEYPLYEMYIFNIWHLINTYKLKYYWFNIEENKWYNGLKGALPHNFNGLNQDPWLKKYSFNKFKLGQDIINNGTFTPFFFQQINNYNFVRLGRHRLYSLILNNRITPIKKNFLFIEFPLFQDIQNNETLEEIKTWNQKLYFFDPARQKPILKQPKNQSEFFYIMNQNGDILSHYFHRTKIKPFEGFNNEQIFNNWINNPKNGQEV